MGNSNSRTQTVLRCLAEDTLRFQDRNKLFTYTSVKEEDLIDFSVRFVPGDNDEDFDKTKNGFGLGILHLLCMRLDQQTLREIVNIHNDKSLKQPFKNLKESVNMFTHQVLKPGTVTAKYLNEHHNHPRTCLHILAEQWHKDPKAARSMFEMLVDDLGADVNRYASSDKFYSSDHEQRVGTNETVLHVALNHGNYAVENRRFDNSLNHEDGLIKRHGYSLELAELLTVKYSCSVWGVATHIDSQEVIQQKVPGLAKYLVDIHFGCTPLHLLASLQLASDKDAEDRFTNILREVFSAGLHKQQSNEDICSVGNALGHSVLKLAAFSHKHPSFMNELVANGFVASASTPSDADAARDLIRLCKKINPSRHENISSQSLNSYLAASGAKPEKKVQAYLNEGESTTPLLTAIGQHNFDILPTLLVNGVLPAIPACNQFVGDPDQIRSTSDVEERRRFIKTHFKTFADFAGKWSVISRRLWEKAWEEYCEGMKGSGICFVGKESYKFKVMWDKDEDETTDYTLTNTGSVSVGGDGEGENKENWYCQMVMLVDKETGEIIRPKAADDVTPIKQSQVQKKHITLTGELTCDEVIVPLKKDEQN